MIFISYIILKSYHSKKNVHWVKNCGGWSPISPRGCYGPAKNIVTVVQVYDRWILLVSAYVMFESKTKWFMNCSIWMDIVISKLLMIFLVTKPIGISRIIMLSAIEIQHHISTVLERQDHSNRQFHMMICF